MNVDKIIIDENKENIRYHHRKKRSKIAKKISSVTPLLAIVSFLALGFCLDAWHPGWLIFFIVPIVGVLVE